MAEKMKAAVMNAVKKIDMEQQDIPKPKPHEVLVKIKHVGICGSDLHYYEHGRIGDFIVNGPIILGHECGGEVVEVGHEVDHLVPGDLVALEPGYTCGKCVYCKTGRYNLCADVIFMATPPYDGAFVEYVAYPADMAFKLPDGMTTLEGALIEPLAVGFHGAKQGGAEAGQTAVVLGSGCIGLVTMMALKSMGVTNVFMTDLLPKRLEMAQKLGATAAFKADEVDVIDAVMQATNGRGVDMVFETAGSRIATQQTVELVTRGGSIVLVGLAPDGVIPYDLGKLISKEATIRTVFRYRNLYPAAISAVASGSIPLKEIVTHSFAFENTDKAMAFSIANKPEIVKGVITL